MNKLLHIKVFTFNYNAPILNMIYSQFKFCFPNLPNMLGRNRLTYQALQW